MNRNIEIRKSIDWIAILIFSLIALIGLITIYSASYQASDATLSFGQLLLKTQYGKQAIWVTIGIVLAFLLCNVEGRLFEILAIPSYVISLLLIVVTIIIAVGTKGADAWINIGSFKLQPCEFMKLATCLVVAKYLSRHEFRHTNRKDILISLFIISFPMLMIIAQKDTGSALVFLFLYLVLYRAGVLSGTLVSVIVIVGFTAVLSLRMGTLLTIGIIWGAGLLILGLSKQWKVLLIIISIAAGAAIVLLILNITLFKPHEYDIWNITADTEGVDADQFFLRAIAIQALLLAIPAGILAIIYFYKKQSRIIFVALLLLGGTLVSLVSQIAINYIPEHQQKRIHLFLGMIEDPHGVGWDPHQIEIAIGSGGLAGKGFMNSTQVKNKFISEESTDFIFCTIGEEHGFIGSLLVVSLYLALLLRIIYMAERQRSRFSLIYGYGLALVLFSHILINLCMQLKLLPIIGIPLPLISYGGSSCIAFTIMFFIFIRLDSERQKLLK